MAEMNATEKYVDDQEWELEFVIPGQPYSKANQRRIVRKSPKLGGIMSIKSAPAMAYAKAFGWYCPKLPIMLIEDIEVAMKIYYASRRPDLDESLILDCMQGLIYKNDRQVKSKIILWGLDKTNPRTEIKIRHLS